MRSERGWLLLTLTAEAVVALAEAVWWPAVPPELLIAGPLLAAWRLSARSAAALSALAVLLVMLLPLSGTGTEPGLGGTGPAAADTPAYALTDLGHLVRVLLTAAVGLCATLTARGRAIARRDLARMTRIAHLTQQAIARPLPPAIGGLSVAAHTQSATDLALIGGDVYDITLTPAGPRLIIGDVKGNGLEAVRLSAALLGAFRHTAAAEPDLVRLARTLDTRLSAELGPEDFVTVLLADFVADEVRVVNCGHPAPLRAGRRLDLLEPAKPSPPLGLSPDPGLQRIPLAPAQRLLFYTDGLTEARAPGGAMFPIDGQVRAALTAPTLHQSVTGLLELLHAHTERVMADDLTLILIQPDPVAEASSLTRPRSGRFAVGDEPSVAAGAAERDR